ncbi:MAG TPA: hypothetical protein VG055_04450 [Planctomycetaceae bacterium]|nr:hypothetical protein [Planctomycetaceae bacterium]
MARKVFNLSAEIRALVEKDKTISFADAWTQLTAKKKGINEGTAKATFYKLRGGSKGRRKVRRLKPSAKGSGGLTAALKFVREAGSVEAAKAQLDSAAKLIAVAREVD